MEQQLKPCTSELTQLIPNKKHPRFHETLETRDAPFGSRLGLKEQAEQNQSGQWQICKQSLRKNSSHE